MSAVEHHFSEDGRTLFVTVPKPGMGQIECEMSWPTRALAQANYETALRRFEAGDFGSEVNQVGQGQRLHRVGPFWLKVMWGPPTWWLPRMHVVRKRGHRRVMIGWLQRAVVISTTRSARERFASAKAGS